MRTLGFLKHEERPSWHMLFLATLLVGFAALLPMTASAKSMQQSGNTDGSTQTFTVMLPMLVAETPQVNIISDGTPPVNTEVSEIVNSDEDLVALGSCLGSAVGFGASNVGKYRATGWSQTFTTSNRCNDINFYPYTSMYIQVRYWKSNGALVTKSWKYVSSGRWNEPVTNIRDGVRFQVRLYNHKHYNRNLHGSLAY